MQLKNIRIVRIALCKCWKSRKELQFTWSHSFATRILCAVYKLEHLRHNKAKSVIGRRILAKKTPPKSVRQDLYSFYHALGEIRTIR
jgi:hypothetical protein